MYRPTRVLAALKEKPYPLDESLLLTRQYGIREASAFLLERNGAIDLAVRELYEVVEESIRVFCRTAVGVAMQARTRSVSVNNQIHLVEIKDFAQLKAIIETNINEIIEVLARNRRFEQSEPEWYALLDKVLI